MLICLLIKYFAHCSIFYIEIHVHAMLRVTVQMAPAIVIKKDIKMSQLMRLWCLSHRRPAQTSLPMRAVLPEPYLFAHMKYGVDEGSDQKSDI